MKVIINLKVLLSYYVNYGLILRKVYKWIKILNNLFSSRELNIS